MFNAPPKPQQQGFNAPPQPQQQGFNAPPKPLQGTEVFVGGIMRQNETLRAGQFVSSPNKKFHLYLQQDGNLVLYTDRSFEVQHKIWATETNNKGQAPHSVKLEVDGNFALYDRNNTVTWSSNTKGKGQAPYKISLLDNRNFVLQDRNNATIFQTNTTEQQGFNAPPQPQQQQGFNAPPQPQGFNAPPQPVNPELVKIEKEKKDLEHKKQDLVKEEQKLKKDLVKEEHEQKQELQHYQVESQKINKSQAVEAQKQNAELEQAHKQLLAKQEAERKKLEADQKHARDQMVVKFQKENQKHEEDHKKKEQKIHHQVTHLQQNIAKHELQLKEVEVKIVALDKREKEIKNAQPQFNKPPGAK